LCYNGKLREFNLTHSQGLCIETVSHTYIPLWILAVLLLMKILTFANLRASNHKLYSLKTYTFPIPSLLRIRKCTSNALFAIL